MILIIDDDSAVRSSLSFMLKRAGYVGHKPFPGHAKQWMWFVPSRPTWF